MKRGAKKLFVIVTGIIIIIDLSIEEGALWKNYQKEEGNLKAPAAEEVLQNQYICRYNLERIKAKGLAEGGRLSRSYLRMQAIYRANLDAYLLEELDIRALDEELKNSALGFASPKPENKNLYEKESTMGLEYIYLRNTLYIEYLEEDQLYLLKQQLKTGKTAVTEELKAMVKDTYQKVIRVRDPADWEGGGRFLYPEIQGRKPEIPNQALVLEISNAMEYDASGSLLMKSHMKEKYEYLDKIKKEKEKEYSEKLGAEVYILVE